MFDSLYVGEPAAEVWGVSGGMAFVAGGEDGVFVIWVELWFGADVVQFLVGLGWGVGEGEFFGFDDLFQKRATIF